MKRILMSLGAIVFMGAAAWGATGAFFSDTETSSGNTFSAGSIDLQIDNTSYVTNAAGTLVASPNNTWAMSDLTNQLFFSFADVKPGDIGEDTISIHAGSNDAYACMAADVTVTPENTLVDPEVTAGDAGPAGGNNGELQNFLNFSFWQDDGDNVYEVGETQITALTGPASTIFNGAWSAITATSSNVIPANSVEYVAKAWCFGTLTPAPVAQDGLTTVGPLSRGTGFTCSGAGDNNIAQTDGINVDVSFYSVQARNNAQFSCSQLPAFVGTAGRAVGAALTTYSAPTCNTTVSGSASIQTALNAAAPNSTVCVDATYDKTGDNTAIRMETTGVKLAATVRGVDLDVPVVLSADGVTVTGFDGTIGQAESPAEQAAFYFDNDATNASLTFNQVSGVGSGAAVLTETGANNTGGLIENNVFSGAVQGIYLNPHTGQIMIRYNDFANNVVGIAGLNGALVVANEFTHTTPGSEAIGADPTYDANPATVNFNNFLNGTKLNTYTAITGDVSAENNFWGPSGGAAQTGGTDEVDFTPETLVQYPHN